MKKLCVILPLAGFVYLLLCMGCANKKPLSDNLLTFDSIQVEGTYHLFNDQKKPNCNLSIKFLYPVSFGDSSKLTLLQDIFVKGYFGDNYAGKSPKDAVKLYKEEYLANYKSLETTYDEELEYRGMSDDDDSAFLSYYETSSNSIIYNKGGILTFVVDYSDYTGGAHGSNVHSAFVVNLGQGKLIHENDIFYDDSLDKITKAILQKIMDENEVKDPKDLEYLGYDINSIVPNGNFTVDEQGLTYFYNQYEIAPYVMGIIKVFLSYDEISIYMKKDGPIAALAGK